MTAWDKRQRQFNRLNRLLLLGYIAVTLMVLANGIRIAYGRAILYSVISLALLALPPVVEKLLKITIPADSRLLFYLFCFGAVEFGSAMDGYDLILWWDLFLHGLSGALIGFVGFLVFNGLRRNGGNLAAEDRLLALLFINLTATTSAAIWEYYEFLLDHFLGFNAQMAALGVSDTMTDMMICSAGGLVLSLWLARAWYGGKRNLLLDCAAHFYYRNGKDS